MHTVQGMGQKGGGARAAPAPPAQASVEATVFVRGLPLDALQYEVQDRMSRYGRLKACRSPAPHNLHLECSSPALEIT